MIVDTDALVKMLPQQAREELLAGLANYFPADTSNLQAAAKRSKILRLTSLPAPTEAELIEARSGKMSNFIGLYRNRVNSSNMSQISLYDAKDLYDQCRV